MKLGNYESYQAVTTDDLVQLNDLLVRAYADNTMAKAASKKHKYDFVSKVRFDSLDTSKEHILTREIGDSSPCGAITIYKDTKHSLPIELCLNITLNPIRTKISNFIGTQKKFRESIIAIYCSNTELL
jgi:hypothetical protein